MEHPRIKKVGYKILHVGTDEDWPELPVQTKLEAESLRLSQDRPEEWLVWPWYEQA